LGSCLKGGIVVVDLERARLESQKLVFEGAPPELARTLKAEGSLGQLFCRADGGGSWLFRAVCRRDIPASYGEAVEFVLRGKAQFVLMTDSPADDGFQRDSDGSWHFNVRDHRVFPARTTVGIGRPRSR
jgi:hypothetical protein